MFDLIVGLPATCGWCRRVTGCVRVRLWDGSFAGRLCRDDLIRLVSGSGKHPDRGISVTEKKVWESETGTPQYEMACGRPDYQSDGYSPPLSPERRREKVLAELETFLGLLKNAGAGHRAAFTSDVLSILHEALDVCPNDILDRLLDAGRTDQPAPLS